LILAAFWQQMLPTRPVLPVLPTAKYYFINNLVFDPQHGMEEVIGSIPIRSTNFSPFLGANRRQFCAPLNRGAPPSGSEFGRSFNHLSSPAAGLSMVRGLN
jgi:hypothetical protein